MDNLRMKFSASNVDFNGPSLDFLGLCKLAHEGIKKRYPPEKSLFFRCWPVASFVKTVADKPGHAIGFRAFPER